jgi:hypothetical protein
LPGLKKSIFSWSLCFSIPDLLLVNKLRPFTILFSPQICPLVKNKPAYSLGYHILAGLARRVVNIINQDPEFGRACLTFINMSPIIQLHLQSQVNGDDVAVTGFTSKYPPNFEGSILLGAGKSYYSTGVNGRCAFGYEPFQKKSKGKASKATPQDSITESSREKRSTNISSGRERR